MNNHSSTQPCQLPPRPMAEVSTICLQRWQSPCGELLLGSIDGQLCLCDWTSSHRHEANLRRLTRFFKADMQERQTVAISQAIDQLQAYFRGERTRFELPMVFAGTVFQQRVWQELLRIPYGETRTYAEQASSLGCPKSVRAVAGAIGANALSIVVPCHRVVGANHSLTGYAGGLAAKRFLLATEGL